MMTIKELCQGRLRPLTFRSQGMQRKAAELQDAAMSEPVVITYHDRPRLVLMSMQEYDRLRGRSRKVGAIEDLPDSVANEIEELGEDGQNNNPGSI